MNENDIANRLANKIEIELKHRDIEIDTDIWTKIKFIILKEFQNNKKGESK